MRNTKNYKQKIIGLLLLIAIVVAAIISLASLHTSTPERSDATETAPSMPKESSKTGNSRPANNIQIKEVDALKTVVTDRTPPEGWQTYTDSTHEFKISYPPEWQPPQVVIRQSTAPELDNYAIAFLDSSGQQQECCKLYVSDKSFKLAVSDFEKLDTGDDGQLTDAPGRGLRDIKEKDNFTFDGRAAVRFFYTDRLSSSSAVRSRSIYYIESNNKTYVYHSESRDATMNDISYIMLRQLLLI
jgi:hypothetical protein